METRAFAGSAGSGGLRLTLRGVLQFTDGALARAIVLMTSFVKTGTSPAPRNISFIMKNVGKP